MIDEERVKKVFNDALEIDLGARDAFLRTACGVDAELRNEVVSLLKSYDRVEDFLVVPAVKISAGEITEQILETEEATAVGRLVGAYRIQSEIGRGGMGSVYLATRADQEFTKHVAIKLLRRGTENESVVRRFKKERQVLADLEHPHIARLIDGGTTENGLPYFVMEYVAGLPIDKFCDQRKLTATERLVLFRQVCTAVEFAHAHSIIHRDLKPGNIHVNDEGVPKLLDFGIAKSDQGNLNSESTATAFRLMTPEYASPEQMRGDPVGKATDIYSLGVVLYQLITGRRPYDLDKRSPLQIVQAICDETPAAPSSIPRPVEQSPPAGMRPELDKIILKAIRKEPEHRYGSAREFSDDIGRLLEGLPVIARRESLFYRGANFYRRNRTKVLSVAAALLVLIVAMLSFTIWKRPKTLSIPAPSRVSNAASDVRLGDRRKGGTENAEARELYVKAQDLWQTRTIFALNFAVKLFQDAIAKDPEFALAYSGLSNTYFLLSVWNVMSPKTGFPKAKEASLRAIALAPALPEGHLSLAMVHWLYEYDWPAADSEFKKAIELDPNYSRAPHWYGLFLGEMGRFDEAISSEKRAEELEPESVPIKSDLARVYYYARRYDEALARYRSIVVTYPAVVAFYYEVGELYEATESMNELFSISEKLNGGPNPEGQQAYRERGMRGYWELQVKYYETKRSIVSPYRAAEFYAQTGDADRAIEFIEKAIEGRGHQVAQLKVNPRFDPLRSDPRFIAILKRLRLDT